MTASAQRAAEIELQIGLKPGSGFATPHVTVADGTLASNFDLFQPPQYRVPRFLLQEWMIAKGLPENYVYDKNRCTDTILRNAYHGGDAYLQKIDTRKSKGKFSSKKSLSIPLDLLKAKPEFEAETWDPAPATAPQEASVPTSIPTLSGMSKEEILDLLKDFAADVAKTVKDEISSKTEAVKKELRFQIEAEVETVVRRVAAELLPRVIEVKTPSGIKTLDPAPRHKAFDKIVRWLLGGEHIILVGPAGTGKTHLFSQCAEAIGKKMVVMGQALTKYEFSGFIDGSGTYRGTALHEAVTEGHLLALDEIDTFGAQALAFLNSALANRFIAFPSGMVEVHPNFQVIAAANTFGRGATAQYVGRNPLDAASLDRFTYEICDYDPELEVALYGNSSWVRYVQAVRKAVEDLKLRHIVSMRATKRCLVGEAAGFTPDEVAFAALWRGLEPDQVQKIKSIVGNPPVSLSRAA